MEGVADVFENLCTDTADESAGLLDILGRLDERDWATLTGCTPWTIGDQVSHLAWNDDAAVRALTDPDDFRSSRPTTPESIQAMVDAVIVDHHDMGGATLLPWFRSARATLLDVFGAADPKARMPWYGPDMSVTSKLTARFMETWAHGWDVQQALGVGYIPTDRLRHVVFLGLQALPNAFTTHGLAVPNAPLRIDVALPSGQRLVLGPRDAVNAVDGSAYELAMVVTQRQHVADTSLRAVGPVAAAWLEIAQAFAGPPGARRTPSTPPPPKYVER
jgi:uncharacterized protein (TIGR03084 family)